jgi:hypothetical protein
MRDNTVWDWGYRWYKRTYCTPIGSLPPDDSYNAYRVRFAGQPPSGAMMLAWEEVELIFWARHPVIALRGICKTPRTVAALMALHGAALD